MTAKQPPEKTWRDAAIYIAKKYAAKIGVNLWIVNDPGEGGTLGCFFESADMNDTPFVAWEDILKWWNRK